MLHLFPIAACLAYLIASFFYLRGLFANELEFPRGKRLLLIGLVFHAVFLCCEIFGFYDLHGNPVGFPLTLSLVGGLLVWLFVLLDRHYDFPILGAFIAPIGVVFMFSSGLLFHIEREVQSLNQFSWILSVHLFTTVLALVLFVFATILSVAVIVQETLLKRKKFTFFQRKIPSLRVLDGLCNKFFSLGFVLMAIGVTSGYVFAFTSSIRFELSDPRFFWSLITLAVYAFVVFVRASQGWRGRRAAWVALVGFGVLVASFVSVNVVGQSFHVY